MESCGSLTGSEEALRAVGREDGRAGGWRTKGKENAWSPAGMKQMFFMIFFSFCTTRRWQPVLMWCSGCSVASFLFHLSCLPSHGDAEAGIQRTRFYFSEFPSGDCDPLATLDAALGAEPERHVPPTQHLHKDICYKCALLWTPWSKAETFRSGVLMFC